MPSQAFAASVCFAGVTSPSDSVVCLWIKLLARQYTHSFHIPPSPTAQPSNWGYLSLYLAWVLCFALLTFRLSMGSFTFPIPHYPVPQQHLFNFLCGAIRAAHPSLSVPSLSLPSSNLKWKVVCHINTHAICTSFRWKETQKWYVPPIFVGSK